MQNVSVDGNAEDGRKVPGFALFYGMRRSKPDARQRLFDESGDLFEL